MAMNGPTKIETQILMNQVTIMRLLSLVASGSYSNYPLILKKINKIIDKQCDGTYLVLGIPKENENMTE